LYSDYYNNKTPSLVCKFNKKLNLFNFVAMKKSTIWILGIVMGLSFLSLLYLQVSYIEEMMKLYSDYYNNKTPSLVCKFNKKLNLFLAFFYLY